MIKYFIAFLFSLLFLSGCVTPYQPDGLSGGYREMALAPDIYKVSFRGNGYSSKDYVQSNLLRRCSEITLQQGYKYFIIMASDGENNQSFYTSPTTVQSNSYGNFSGFGNMNANRFGNSIYGNFNMNGYSNQNTNTIINPGSSFVVNRYTHVVVIKLLKDNKKYPNAFDAMVILSQTTQ